MKTLFTQNKAVAIFDAKGVSPINSFIRCHLYTIGASLQYEQSFVIEDCSIKANQLESFTYTENEITLSCMVDASIFKITYFLKTGKVNFTNYKNTSNTTPRLYWFQQAYEKMQNIFKQPQEPSFT